ncbi:MAG: Penicillin-binding protein 1A [Clostridia bacterium 41_269]|nr:MAG: Penicillin-binding protein 1A [Clostridia bacterium 41_269]
MPKKKKRKLNFFRAFLLLVLTLAFIGFGIGTGFVFGIIKNLPDLDSDSLNAELTTFIHDKDGKQVASLHGVENRIPVKLEQVPEELKQAFIATEDRNFYRHPGINPIAFVRAAIANFKAGKIVQGGSTITMQLAENAFFAEKPERSYRRKIQEAIMAIQLERKYTKDEILEAYLNYIYFGHGAYGVQAAAQTYFGKDVEDLTLGECAIIAGVTNNPALYSPYRNLEAAKQRRSVVLDNMVEAGFISRERAEEAKNEPIKLAQPKQKTSRKYPYFIDAVVMEAEKLLKEKGMHPADLYRSGLHIYTTLDTSIQEAMEKVYEDDSNFPRSPDNVPVQSAMVVLDPQSGEVRGIIGGREHTVERGFNRAIQGGRQPGSAIKPIAVYAPALEKGYTAATVIDDVPVTYRQSDGKTYSPKNYDNQYRGLITMREAVRWSVNIPAVKLLDTIGVETGYNFAKEVGLPLNPSDKGLSLALGGLTKGVSPLDMAAAYGTFANKGIWIQPHTITKITDHEGNTLFEVKPEQKAVMSEQNAYIMTNILETVVNSGTGTRARMNGWPVAGKTGTTQLPDRPEFRGIRGERDAWFVGYTPELVGVVWLGYDKTTTKHYLRGVYGGSYAAPIWRKVMIEAHKQYTPRNFEKPEGITWVTVDAKSGKLPSSLTPSQFRIREIFTTDTVPKEVSDVWVRKEVCALSGKLPTESCPVVSKVFLKRPIPYHGSVRPNDAYLEAPREKCNIHQGKGSTVIVKICTDPRHNGIPVLANVPIEGQEGGCPSEYVAEKEFTLEEAPKTYCNLPDHQLGEATSGNNSDSSASAPPEPSLTGEAYVSPDNSSAFVTLRWRIPQYNGSVYYTIEKWSNSNFARQNAATTSRNTWTDHNVRVGNTYYYRVTAIDRNTQRKAQSNTIRVIIRKTP